MLLIYHMDTRAITSEALVDRALRALEERFVTMQLPPGSVWSEAALSDMLKIGRTPVREAIARMAMDGLVTVMPRAGIVISQISVEAQLQVLDTRRVLEKLVSVRAAQRATDGERKELRVMADAIDAAGRRQDVHAYLQQHFRVKRFVTQCARNPYAERALRPLHTFSQRFYFCHHREFDNLPVVGPAHADLTRAIAEGDGARASSRCDVVSDIAESFTRELLVRPTRQAIS